MPMQQQPQNLTEFFGSLFQTASDRIQAAAATGAILLPYWLPDLKAISAEAALFAPILGCVWFAIQITLRLIEFNRKARK
jgi:alpha-beta hydrolase superfamily lysophospholipase